jgi:hypothetical protein
MAPLASSQIHSGAPLRAASEVKPKMAVKRPQLRPQHWIALPTALILASSLGCAPQAKPDGQAAEAPGATSPALQVAQEAALPKGRVQGLVATPDGKGDYRPVSGAKVSVGGVSGVTGADGTYRLDGVAPGDHELVASAEGMPELRRPVSLSPVAGLDKANVLLQAPARQLLQAPATGIAPFTATVSGVVTDPRGAAMNGASVKVLCNVANFPANSVPGGLNTTVSANGNGFYTVSMTNVQASPASPGQVQVTANGTSPGAVRLETVDVYALAITGSTVVVNPQCKAFTRPGTPSFPNGTFSPPGNDARIRCDYMSGRSDEFYIRLTSGGSTYDVLPNSQIVLTPAAGATPPYGETTFRIPFTMPAGTFTARIVPFGQTTQMTAASPSFVTAYTQTDLDADISYGATNSLTDTTTNRTIYTAKLIGNDEVQYALRLNNASASVSQDLRVEGTVKPGTVIASAAYSANGGPDVAIPGGSITQPDGTGRFGVQGFNAPTAGNVIVKVNFRVPFGFARGTLFDLTSPALKMVSAGLTKATPPAVPTPANIPVANVDPANLVIRKTITNDGIADDGVGLVRIEIGASGAALGNMLAWGAFRISDRTKTNQVTAASKATYLGTATLPAAGTALGLTGADRLVVSIDGGATQTVNVLANNWDLETFNGFVNAVLNQSGTKVSAIRTGANRFQLERTEQGTTRTLQVTTDSSANLLARLGLTAGPVVAGSNGVLPDFALTFSAQQGTSLWSMPSANRSLRQEADGSVVAEFDVQPPTAFGVAADEIASLVIQYRVRGPAGVGATSLGGGGANPFGTRVLNTNLVPPFDNIGFNQLLSNGVGDPAVVGNI